MRTLPGSIRASPVWSAEPSGPQHQCPLLPASLQSKQEKPILTGEMEPWREKDRKGTGEGPAEICIQEGEGRDQTSFRVRISYQPQNGLYQGHPQAPRGYSPVEWSVGANNASVCKHWHKQEQGHVFTGKRVRVRWARRWACVCACVRVCTR